MEKLKNQNQLMEIFQLALEIPKENQDFLRGFMYGIKAITEEEEDEESGT